MNRIGRILVILACIVLVTTNCMTVIQLNEKSESDQNSGNENIDNLENPEDSQESEFDELGPDTIFPNSEYDGYTQKHSDIYESYFAENVQDGSVVRFEPYGKNGDHYVEWGMPAELKWKDGSGEPSQMICSLQSSAVETEGSTATYNDIYTNSD
ncbi:MAG: hypothetical protein JSV49_01045, partial [Thermoplasmata archaeon]